jgi:hypothetical protein
MGVVSVDSSVKTSSSAYFHVLHIVWGGLCLTGQCHEMCRSLHHYILIAHSSILPHRMLAMLEMKNTRRHIQHILMAAKVLWFTCVDVVSASMIGMSPILARYRVHSDLMDMYALHACNESHKVIIKLGRRILGLYCSKY